MSQYQAFRRTAVPPQMAQRHSPHVIPAPTRGIVQSENFAFMNPGAALISDNWLPTMRGVKLRGGHIVWCTLPAVPVISGFSYVSGSVQRMFAGQQTELYDVSFSGGPTLVKAGQTSGNYAAAQLATATGDYLIAVNEAGDPPLRFDGTSWTTLNGGQITGPPGSGVVAGENLCYVWKYRGRLFFIEVGTMNAWYLPLNAIGGALQQIPLSGAAAHGGKLLFGATWSIDAGDGIDDKCVFMTTEGEVIIFTGSDPSNATNWRQEGRYQMSHVLGMNAHVSIGGDLLIATTDGIIPISAAISKDVAQLELAAITRNIKPMWREEVLQKQDKPWNILKWDEYGGIFVSLPGSKPGKWYSLAANLATGAWGRIVGWDANCWLHHRGELFFGTQDGKIMQGDRTGLDNGLPYVATLVGGWGALPTGGAHAVWHQMRATFLADVGEPFVPQLAACTNYTIRVPQPPNAGADPGVEDVWDQGKWDQAKWDQASSSIPTIRDTGWVSIGETGYSHAPIVQVTVAQQAKPTVELVSMTATYERLAVNV